MSWFFIRWPDYWENWKQDYFQNWKKSPVDVPDTVDHGFENCFTIYSWFMLNGHVFKIEFCDPWVSKFDTQLVDNCHNGIHFLILYAQFAIQLTQLILF